MAIRGAIFPLVISRPERIENRAIREQMTRGNFTAHVVNRRLSQDEKKIVKITFSALKA